MKKKAHRQVRLHFQPSAVKPHWIHSVSFPSPTHQKAYILKKMIAKRPSLSTPRPGNSKHNDNSGPCPASFSFPCSLPALYPRRPHHPRLSRFFPSHRASQNSPRHVSQSHFLLRTNKRWRFRTLSKERKSSELDVSGKRDRGCWWGCDEI